MMMMMMTIKTTSDKWRYCYFQCSPIAERAFAFRKTARLRPFVLLATVTCRWKWVCSIGGRTLMGKGRRTRRNPVPVPLCPPQTSQRVTYARIRDFEVRVRSRTTCNMSRLWRLRLEYILFINLVLTLILSVKKNQTIHRKIPVCYERHTHHRNATREYNLDSLNVKSDIEYSNHWTLKD